MDPDATLHLSFFLNPDGLIRRRASQVFSSNVSFIDHHLLRVQLARMTPGAEIKRYLPMGRAPRMTVTVGFESEFYY